MVKIKLWSYGDSHAAGHELGSDADLGASWLLENYGSANRQDIVKKLGQQKYNDTVKKRWHEHIKHKTSGDVFGTPCSPELSYAGQLAKLLGYEYINNAVPGSSNDYSVLRFIRDLPNIGKKDLVVFSAVTPTRFLHSKDEIYTRTQIQWLPEKVQKTFFDYGPNDKSFSLWSQGLIHLVKNSHKKTLFLRTCRHDTYPVEGVDTTETFFPLNDFTTYSFEKYGSDIRYVGGHIHERCHLDYARYVYNWMIQNFKGL